MRLLHYSAERFEFDPTRAYPHEGAAHRATGVGFAKTPGLWVSVEGEDDWPAYCEGNYESRLETMAVALQIVLRPDHGVCWLTNTEQFDAFNTQFGFREDRFEIGYLDWHAIRAAYRGLIIAPYQWDRRLDNGCNWYYGWDCASGVIWDLSAIESAAWVEGFQRSESPSTKADQAE